MNTTASQKLSALEAKALAGEKVTAADLAAAQAAVRIEELTAEGDRIREAEAATKSAAERREAAMAEAAALLKGHGTDDIVTRWIAAYDALEALVAGIDAHNQVIKDAGRILSQAGVQPVNPHAVEQHEHFDAANTYGQEHGQVKSVTVGGKGLNTLSGLEGALVGHVVQDVSRRHNGLTVPSGRSIEGRLNLGSFGATDGVIEEARRRLTERAAA